MSEFTKEVHFMGLLANVDRSILSMKLEHGFEICSMPQEKAVLLISKIEGLPPYHANMKLLRNHILEGEDLYYISNSLEDDIEMTDDGFLAKPLSEVMEFSNSLVRDLDEVIRLMRLFKEGNIRMPFRYYYYIDDDSLEKPLQCHFLGILPPIINAYRLEGSEIQELKRFLKDIGSPFKERSLQLAFQNYDSSYSVFSVALSFLSLMVSLEVLLNPGGGELTYRISRNAAVLLGKDRCDSKRIFKEIKDLYKKRSNLVHSGKGIDREDLLKLRQYVRESIKEMNYIGKSKDEILKMLNTYGFGERPWRTQ